MNYSKYVNIEKKFVNRIFAALFLFGITLMFLLMIFVPVTTISHIDMSSPLGIVLSMVENGNTDERIFSYGIMFSVLFSLFVLIPYSVISTIAFIKFIIALIKGNDTGIISQFISALVLYIMGVVITYNLLQHPGAVFPLVYVVIVFGFLVIVGYSVLAHFLYGSLKENYKMLIFAGARAFLILMIILLLLGSMFFLNNHMINFADYTAGRIYTYDSYDLGSAETSDFAQATKIISAIFNIGILFSLVLIFKTVLLNLLTKKTSCFSTSSLIFNIFANTYVLVVLFQAIVLDNAYKSFSTNPKSADYIAYNETFIKRTFSEMFNDFGDVTARFLGTKFFAVFILAILGFGLLIGSVIFRIVLNNKKLNAQKETIVEPVETSTPVVEEKAVSNDVVETPVVENTPVETPAEENNVDSVEENSSEAIEEKDIPAETETVEESIVEETPVETETVAEQSVEETPIVDSSLEDDNIPSDNKEVIDEVEAAEIADALTENNNNNE